MRPIWTGSIGFGLVNIPVKMYSATEECNLPFITLDKNNHARIRYKKVNETTGKEMDPKDIVKGYKVGKEYVIVEDEDFEKATPEKLDHLEIVQFVSEKEIDAVYFEKPYYLEPDKTGMKAYCLLRDALKKEGKAGGVTEDEEKQAEKEIQKLTDQYIAKIDAHLAHKEKEIMTV